MRAVKLPLLEKKSGKNARSTEKMHPALPGSSPADAVEPSRPLSSPVFEESLLSELLQKEPVPVGGPEAAASPKKEGRPSPLFRLLTSSACLFSLLLLTGAVFFVSYFLRGGGMLEVYLDGVPVGYAESNEALLDAVRDFEKEMSARLGDDVIFDGEITYRFAAGAHTPTAKDAWQDILYTSVEEEYCLGTALVLDGKRVGILPDKTSAGEVLTRILSEKNTLLAGENERIELRNTVTYEEVLCRNTDLLGETELCLLLTEGDESLADFRNSLVISSGPPAADASPSESAGQTGTADQEKSAAPDGEGGTKTSESASQIVNYAIGGGFNLVYDAARESENTPSSTVRPSKEGVSADDGAASDVRDEPVPVPIPESAPSSPLTAKDPVSVTVSGGHGSNVSPEAAGESAGAQMTDLPILPSEQNPSSFSASFTVAQTVPTGKLLKYQTVIVREEVVTESCKTVYLPTENLYEGQSELYQSGLDGLRRDKTEVTFADGKLLFKTVLSSEYLLEPRSEIIFVGRRHCAATGIFLWPHRGLVTSGFGNREIFGEASTHLGLDIDGKTGDEIVAADGGVVSFAGYHDSYGYLTIIDHENGYESYYAHQSEQFVSTGDRVYQGQRIGLIGETGNAAGSHLHFELHKSGVTIDPTPLLRAGETASSTAEKQTGGED